MATFNTAKYDYNPTIDEVTSDKYIRIGEICGSNNVRGIQIIPRWVRRMNNETVFVQTKQLMYTKEMNQ